MFEVLKSLLEVMQLCMGLASSEHKDIFPEPEYSRVIQAGWINYSGYPALADSFAGESRVVYRMEAVEYSAIELGATSGPQNEVRLGNDCLIA